MGHTPPVGIPGAASEIVNPGVSFIQQQAEQRDVGAAEAGGFFPGVTVAKEADDRNRMSDAAAGFLPPNADDEKALAKFVDRFSGHGWKSQRCIGWRRFGRTNQKWPVGEPTGRKPKCKT